MAEVFKNYPSAAIGTTPTTVYTAGTGVTSVVIGMTVANILTNTQIAVDVKANVGGTAVYLVRGAAIAVGGAMIPIGGDQKVVLEAGDYISVTSSAASSADVLLSVLEQS